MSLQPPRPAGSGPAPKATPERPGRAKPATTRVAALPLTSDPAPALPASGRVKVQAVKAGYYGHIRRRPGDVFSIEQPSEFSRIWMQVVDPDEPDRITLGTQAIREDHDQRLTQKAQEAALRRGAMVRPPFEPPTGEANPLGDED